MEPHTWTGLFIAGLIVAFGDAFGIGANDVANSFATSVGSRSLTMKQAVMIAVFTELGGAILFGASTTDTIKNGIISISLFKGQPETLMLAFVCALFGSATWVLSASHFGLPVSTTHSIVGAVAGVGVAAFGGSAVTWGWEGMGKIIASWFISPVVAGIIASIIYLLTKYFVMVKPNSLERGLRAVPIYFTLTFFIGIMYILIKGGKSIKLNSDNMPLVLGVAAGASLFVGIFTAFFYTPWLRRKLVNEEKMRWYHVFMTPFLGPQEHDPSVSAHLNNRFTHHGEHSVDQQSTTTINQAGPEGVEGKKEEDLAAIEEAQSVARPSPLAPLDAKPSVSTRAGLFVKKALFGNMNRDIASMQSGHAAKVHAHAVKYDSKTEYLYSFLQICTAAIASFAHGSNDVANAIGPLAAIYSIWETGLVPGKKAVVPIWILAYGGVAIDFGLLLLGWRVMANLGGNMTYQSPSRGFAMELGAAITVLTASFIGLPVSTTHCITGATVFVGICNGTAKALNWKLLTWVMLGWIFTVPIAGVISGLLFAVLTNTPKMF